MPKKHDYLFHNRIVLYRLRKNLTQQQLAELCDTSQNVISELECQKWQPSAYLAGLLCIALNVKFEELFVFA